MDLFKGSDQQDRELTNMKAACAGWKNMELRENIKGQLKKRFSDTIKYVQKTDSFILIFQAETEKDSFRIVVQQAGDGYKVKGVYWQERETAELCCEEIGLEDCIFRVIDSTQLAVKNIRQGSLQYIAEWTKEAAGLLAKTPEEIWDNHMDDSIKAQCTFDEIKIFL